MARWIIMLTVFAVAACIAIGCSGGSESPVTPSVYLQLLTPNGGEEWVPGTSEEITWTSRDVTGTVAIEYSKDNFISDMRTIAIDARNDGSFMWKDIPLDPSSTVWVRVSSTENPGVCDVSDADFTIVGPWIEVLTPNGGEEWNAETSEEITWTSQDVIGSVFIEYSKDNFISDINLISQDEPNDGSYIWTDIPYDISDTVRVRVSSTDYPGLCGISDGDFRIYDFGWAKTWGGPDRDCGEGVAIDGSGNVYVTGYFESTVVFDPGSSDQHTSNGSSDVFLCKYDSSGNFEWARTWGGAALDYSEGVAADGFGNVYVTGYFCGTVDFDPDGGDPHNSKGYSDVFLSKFDSSGNFEWARTWGGTALDYSEGVAVGGSGNVYVTGHFEGTVGFDPGGGDYHTSHGEADAFLSKFDSSGNHQWARTWGGSDEDCARGVVVGGSGNVYVTGEFQDTADFDPGGGDTHVSNGGYDVFLSKYDSSGSFEWARTWGGAHSDHGESVAADDNGDACYITGEYRDTVDFDPGGGDSHTSNGGNDVYLSKFDSSGNFKWARTWGGPAYDGSRGVAADGSGNVCVAGNFRALVDFDPGGGDPHTSNGDADSFLSKFDSSGGFVWARTWGGSDHDNGYGVAADVYGNVYVAGYFMKNAVDFAPSGPTCNNDPDEHTSNGDKDAFLIKHLPDGCW